MKSRPKIMINVFVFNSEGNKLLIGKRFHEDIYSLISCKLSYGEEFDECAAKILSNTVNIVIENKKRINFLCTYNLVGNGIHNISVDFYFQITNEEEKYHLNVDSYYFKSWDWYTYEELIKMHDSLFYGIQFFLKKFNIKTLDDIKNIISN